MTISRRSLLMAGGLLLAGSAAPLDAKEEAEIRMIGTPDGSSVRFAPRGLFVRPGTTIRWRNADPGNSHTSTAFHPRNTDHQLRIPRGAKPWDSDYLLPDEAFSVTLIEPGVYDYFCVPHEMAGMVGRIVVALPGAPAPIAVKGMEDLFPSVTDIIRAEKVDP